LDGESCGRVSIYENSQAAELVHSIAPIVASLCDAAWSGQEICEPTACDGEPCGGRTPAPSGPGTPGGSSGCSASTGSTGSTGLMSWALGLVLLLMMRRFRRPVA
jgi:MYXO-CTERM domain-containing protein